MKTYHRSHRFDDRLEVSKKYREEAEKAELDREMKEVADDIFDSMNEDLDDVLNDEKYIADPVDDYNDFPLKRE